MGNCITSGKLMIPQDAIITEFNHEAAGKAVAELDATYRTSSGGGATKNSKTEKESCKDRCDDDISSLRKTDGIESKKKKAVRVRVVMTQEELSQILNYYKNGACAAGNNHVSVGELLNSMKLSRRKVLKSRGNDDQDGGGGWRPALESIPEDH